MRKAKQAADDYRAAEEVMEHANEYLCAAAETLIKMRDLPQPRAGMYCRISEVNREGVSFISHNGRDDVWEYFDFTYTELEAALVAKGHK